MAKGKESVTAAQAKAALAKDAEARAKELGEIIQRESTRLRCDLVAVCEIVGNQVQTAVRVIPRTE